MVAIVVLRVPAHHRPQEPRLSRAEGTCALVVAPTRELCLQIQDVAVNLLKRYHWLVRAAVFHC